MPLFEITQYGLPAFERKALSIALQNLLQEMGWHIDSIHVNFLLSYFEGDMSCYYFHRGRDVLELDRYSTVIKVYVGNIGAENMQRLREGIVKTWEETVNVEKENWRGKKYTPSYKLGSVLIVPGVLQWEG